MNSSFAELLGLLLRLARWKAGISQDEIAELVETSQPTVSRWERGPAVPPIDKIESWFHICLAACESKVRSDIELAQATATSLTAAPFHSVPEEKLEHTKCIIRQLVSGASRPKHALIPFLTDVAAGCGERQEALSCPPSYSEVPNVLLDKDPGCHAMRVVGDSMLPLLQPGDIVVVSPQAQPFDGASVAAYLEPDGDVLRRYRALPAGEIRLEPLNPDYPVISLRPEGGRTARIWGRIIYLQREL